MFSRVLVSRYPASDGSYCDSIELRRDRVKEKVLPYRFKSLALRSTIDQMNGALESVPHAMAFVYAARHSVSASEKESSGDPHSAAFQIPR